jgi:uncharacterized protein (TIGR02145 family)
MNAIVIIILFFPLFAFSQAPQKINFQSVLRNSSGEVVSNKSVKLKISLLQGSMMDTVVYIETHNKTTDISGLISLKIGNGSILKGGFDTIRWGIAPHFIKLEVDFAGGNNFVLLGTQELMSVPYALYANNANNADSIGDFSSSDVANQLKILKSHFSIIDIDGNRYNYVSIGNQIWMAENLRVSRYRNGESIAIVTDNTAWSGLRTGGRSWYNNDSTTYEYPYGNLYNWYAVADNRGICPTGWHVPSDAEWTTLTTYLGGEIVAGGKMKSTGTAYWKYVNTGATNESGFSVLPGGYRVNVGSFFNISSTAFFWSATELDNNLAWNRHLHNNFGNVNRLYDYKSDGASVRCLRD